MCEEADVYLDRTAGSSQKSIAVERSSFALSFSGDFLVVCDDTCERCPCFVLGFIFPVGEAYFDYEGRSASSK